jgi:hypothetical protein
MFLVVKNSMIIDRYQIVSSHVVMPMVDVVV